MPEPAPWPAKTRELHNHHFDSTAWNGFPFRDADIVIATYAKYGTTWLQQIVSQLIFNSEEGLEVAEMSPWVDLRVPPMEVKLPAIEAQTHRRFLKTHLPVDALVQFLHFPLGTRSPGFTRGRSRYATEPRV
jgi:aryl sulfotransferase